MSSREFFGSGGYFWADVVGVDDDQNLTAMLAIESGGVPFVARPSMGHMRRTNDDPNGIDWKFPFTPKPT